MGALWDAGKFPCMIGGNHTVSIGACRAAAKRFEHLTVLQLDAHSDLRPEYEGSALNHACIMKEAQKVVARDPYGHTFEQTVFTTRAESDYPAPPVH